MTFKQRRLEPSRSHVTIGAHGGPIRNLPRLVIALLMSFPPPWVLHRLGQLQRRAAARSFARSAAAPAEAQRDYLLALLAANADSEYGRKYGFADIRTPEEFAARVPLVTYDDLEPYVERLMAGERGLLTTEAPIFYALSTGTTGGIKQIPVTPAYRREFQRTVQVAFWHVYNKFPQAFTGRFLYSVSPRRRMVAGDGLDIGSMSGFNFTEQPPLVRKLYAWPAELFEVADLPTRAYLALYLALVGDVSLITGVFPLPIVTMLRSLETLAEPLAADLASGRLDGAKALSEAQRAFFERHASPRPDLAARVRQLPATPVEARVALVFPKLRLVYCWTTSTAGLYLPELERRLGPGVAVRDAIFAASEAWCNVPMGEETPGGPAAVDSVYLEFIEEQAYQAGSRETMPVTALVQGERYFVVTTNATGFYRYLLGDVVEVRGQYGATPNIHFVRKAGAWSNLAGEALDESHVNAAVGQALQARGLEATWFALVGDGHRPGYTLHLEPAPQAADLPDDALQALAADVDERLRRGVFFYNDVRAKALLEPVAIARVPQGRTNAWRDRRVAEGAGEAQLKTQHLFNEPQALPAEFSP